MSEYTMTKAYVFLLLMLDVFENVHGQEITARDSAEIPIKCTTSKIDITFRTCCILAPFFKRTVSRDCGAGFELSRSEHNITHYRRVILDKCRYWKCLLNKYRLTDADINIVDLKKYYMHLNRWVNLNPEFAQVMIHAKSECKVKYHFALPIEVCEFQQFNDCIRQYIKLNCPLMLNTPECQEVKEFYQECKQYHF